tara:strand:+ start:11131 stop:12126 length:996 start_codon:yes stop_codon:yes gene_type:complete
MFKILFKCLFFSSFFVSSFISPQQKLQYGRIFNSFNQYGDLSGNYQLSGLWKLYREPLENDNYKDNGDISQISWSGDIWKVGPGKRPYFQTMYVVLKSNGIFSTPDDVELSFSGKWYCHDNELNMVRFKSKNVAYETYTGVYNPNDNGTIYGLFTYGAIEPQYAGIFRITKLMSQFNPIIKNKIDKSKYKFNSNHLEGSWQLNFYGNMFVSSYEITLYSNLTWESISVINDNTRLAGRWNIYDQDIDLTTGIAGSGTGVWLWMRRFGRSNAISTGIQLEQDRLYIGKIAPTPHNSNISERILKARNVKGDVRIGWDIDVAFIGSFVMKPIF